MLANTLDFRRQRPLSTYPKEGLYALDIESGCLEAEGGVEAFGLHTGQQQLVMSQFVRRYTFDRFRLMNAPWSCKRDKRSCNLDGSLPPEPQ